MTEEKPKCITHNYEWAPRGKNGITIKKCTICGEEMAVVKIAEYIKFDVKTSKETP